MNNKDRFIDLMRSTNREGVEELLGWLNSNGFYEAPASTRFHGAYAGGLVEHSLNVYDELMRLLKAYPEITNTISDDSAIIAALLHDICKVNMYATEKRNRKNEQGVWESYDAYTHKEKFNYGGHGSKSVFLAQYYIKLKPIEAVAINCHMSCWDGNTTVGSAFEQFPFAWLLHVADESATYVVEGKRENER